MSEKPKIPYTPPENRRFSVSDDAFSRERVQLLKEIHALLKKEIPVPVAITLFGSLSKGKRLTKETADAADIDLAYFVEIPDLKETYGLIYSKYPNLRNVVPLLRERIVNEPLSGKYRLGFNGLEPLKEWEAREFQWRTVEYAIKAIVSSRAGGREINGEGFRLTGEEGEFKQDLLNIKNPFHEATHSLVKIVRLLALDVGGGTKHVRERLFRDFDRMFTAEVRENLWQTILSKLILQERQLAHGKSVSPSTLSTYPRTYAAAKKMYGGK